MCKETAPIPSTYAVEKLLIITRNQVNRCCFIDSSIAYAINKCEREKLFNSKVRVPHSASKWLITFLLIFDNKSINWIQSRSLSFPLRCLSYKLMLFRALRLFYSLPSNWSIYGPTTIGGDRDGDGNDDDDTKWNKWKRRKRNSAQFAQSQCVRLNTFST